MIQKCLLFFVLLAAPLAVRAQVDTVRASTLPGPQLAEKAYNNGLTSFSQQRYPAALASFDQAIAARPDFAAAYTNRATTRFGVTCFFIARRNGRGEVAGRIEFGLLLPRGPVTPHATLEAPTVVLRIPFTIALQILA